MNDQSQDIAEQKINKGENLFVDGSAGVGKSYLLQKVTNNSTIVVAPTGIAALNAGGSTMHKIFGLPFGCPTAEDKREIPPKMRKLFGGDSLVKRINFDEIGMCRSDLIDLVDIRLRKLRHTTEPFGGIQVVGFGDFYQLEPVVGYQESEHLYAEYESAYCFHSKAWNFERVTLDKVWRQKDNRQVQMLNAIRTGSSLAGRALASIINESKPYENSRESLHLCCYKDDARKINSHWYNQEKGRHHVFRAQYLGKPDKWSEVPVEDVVEVKEGCKVLIRANCPSGTYVNGNTGIFVGVIDERALIDIKGRVVRVSPHTWEKNNYSGKGDTLTKEVESSMIQMPLTLGYAVTVHSCQGLTLDDVALDVGKGCFAAGQLYTALSRIRDLKNLSIVNKSKLTTRSLIVSEHVKKYYAGGL